MIYREYVIKSLQKIIKDKKYSNIEALQVSQLINDKTEKDLYLFNLYGVLENLIFIDWVIGKISSIKIAKIDKNVLNILRLGTFQIFFANKPKDSNIVYESVDLTKAYLKKSQGFVNGILRNMLRKKTDILTEIENMEEEDYLSIKYSYPREFLEILIAEMGYENTEKFCIASNKKPEMILRVNNSIISRDKFIEEHLDSEMIFEKTKISKYGVIFKNPFSIENTKEYIEGVITPQDESSMLVAEILNPKKGSNILDMCCAPGGKCLHAAEIMENTGYIEACDVYEHKLKLVEVDIKRLRLKNIATKASDGTILNENYVNKFDYCIVDVPCSNSGIIRRKPEIKYSINKASLEGIVDLQKTILMNASKYLKENGVMVYSTCSIFDSENIDVVNDFLDKNDNFSLLEIKLNDKVIEKGCLQLMPHIDGMDGFFIALIKKN
jgi:16S rRNA (cytosine967-C5)-methyltransferase